MSLLEDIHIHPNELYVDLKDEDDKFSMAVFGLGAQALLQEVRVEVKAALTLDSANPDH